MNELHDIARSKTNESFVGEKQQFARKLILLFQCPKFWNKQITSGYSCTNATESNGCSSFFYKFPLEFYSLSVYTKFF